MPKPRNTMEARIVEWFAAAPLETAELLLGIIQSGLRARRPPAQSTRIKAKLKARKTNAQAPVAPTMTTGPLEVQP